MPSQILETGVLSEAEKDSFIGLELKGDTSGFFCLEGLCVSKFNEGFYNSGPKVGSLARLGCGQGLPALNLYQAVSKSQ